MSLIDHIRYASIEITHAAGFLAKEYYYAGLPCKIADKNGMQAQDIVNWRKTGIGGKDVPLILVPRADLDVLQHQLTDETRRQFLGRRIIDIVPFNTAAESNDPLYAADWVFRLEHRGQVALLPRMLKYLDVNNVKDKNDFVTEVQGLMNRENIEGPLTKAIKKVKNTGVPIAIRFAKYPNRLIPGIRFGTFSVADLIH